MIRKCLISLVVFSFIAIMLIGHLAVFAQAPAKYHHPANTSNPGVVITPNAQPIILQLNQSGTYMVKLSDVATVTGAGSDTVSVSPASFNYSSLGNQTVTVSVTGPYNLLTASFDNPYGMAIDKAGNLYVVDEGSNEIRKISPSGKVTTLAGNGTAGYVDGPGNTAEFNGAYGLTIDGAGNLYVTDVGDNRIRKISPAGVVSTVAGNGTVGDVNGNAANASFDDPVAITVDKSGNIYVCDGGTNMIRKINTAGAVTTVAIAVPPQEFGNVTYSSGMVMDASGNIFVLKKDYIVEITSGGQVIDFAGTPLSTGDVDGQGTAAQFNQPCSIAINAQGDLFVTEPNQNIREVTPGGLVSTLPITGVKIPGCNNIAADAAGNLYLAATEANIIEMVTPAGVASVYAGDGNAASTNNMDLIAQKQIPVKVISAVPAPSVIITSSANNICFSTPVTFTANLMNIGSTGNYQWRINSVQAGTNSPQFTSSILYNNDTVSCVFTPFSMGAVQSITSNSIIMAVVPAATINISPQAALVCEGTELAFTAVITNGGTDPGYQWQVNGVNVGINSPSYSNNNFKNSDLVSCILYNNSNCTTAIQDTSNIAKVVIIPNAATSVSIASSVSGSICPGGAVTFTATAITGDSGPAYQWLVNNKPVGANSPKYTGTNLNNGDIVSCQVTSINGGCYLNNLATSNSITINVQQLINPTISVAQISTGVCAGSPATFTANVSGIGGSPTYQWQVNTVNAGYNSPAFTSDSLNNGDAVSCILTSNTGCLTQVTSAPFSAVINPLPAVSFSNTAIIINEGSNVTLSPQTAGNIANYSWTPAAGLSNAGIQNPVASPVVTTKYNLQVTTTDGCEATGSVTITVLIPIIIPNAFTPNGDGINDVWNIKGLEYYPGCTVNIYNRYGAIIYRSTGYSKAWDGTYNGQALPVGTYYYIINPKNGKQQLSGYVAIIK